MYFKLGSLRVWIGKHGIVGLETPRLGMGWDHCLIECGRLGFWFRIE